jgi:hypothetical protein
VRNFAKLVSECNSRNGQNDCNSSDGWRLFPTTFSTTRLL